MAHVSSSLVGPSLISNGRQQGTIESVQMGRPWSTAAASSVGPPLGTCAIYLLLLADPDQNAPDCRLTAKTRSPSTDQQVHLSNDVPADLLMETAVRRHFRAGKGRRNQCACWRSSAKAVSANSLLTTATMLPASSSCHPPEQEKYPWPCYAWQSSTGTMLP